MTKSSKNSKKKSVSIKKTAAPAKPAKKPVKKSTKNPGQKPAPKKSVKKSRTPAEKITTGEKTENQNLIAVYVSPFTSETELFFKELMSLNAGQVLVVDDSENQKHRKLYKDLGIENVIFHGKNEGLEKSLAEIGEFARKSGRHYLVMLEAKSLIWLEYLNHFLDETRQYDVVSGSQYLDPQLQTDMPNLADATLNKVVSHLLHKQTGVPITDAFATFKAFKIKMLEKINFKNIKFFPVSFWFELGRIKPKFNEIPIPLAESKKKPSKSKLLPPEHKLEIYLKMIEDAAKRKK